MVGRHRQAPAHRGGEKESMMNRKQRQALKRTRDKIERLEGRCDSLIRALDDAAEEFRRAWCRESQLESQNRHMMEMVARDFAMQMPPIIVQADQLPPHLAVQSTAGKPTA